MLSAQTRARNDYFLLWRCESCGRGCSIVRSENLRGCWLLKADQKIVITGFWMSDKPLVQQRLASDLSSLMLSIEPVNDGSSEGIDSRTNAGLDFVAGFWEALVREWTGIDRLR